MTTSAVKKSTKKPVPIVTKRIVLTSAEEDCNTGVGDPNYRGHWVKVVGAPVETREYLFSDTVHAMERLYPIRLGHRQVWKVSTRPFTGAIKFRAYRHLFCAEGMMNIFGTTTRILYIKRER